MATATAVLAAALFLGAPSTVAAADTAPVITAQPQSLSVASGETAIFTAAASGTPTPTVQWQSSSNDGASFTNLSGSTSTTYALPVSAVHTGYRFRAVFTNSAGTVTSSVAVLTVTGTPEIITQPLANQTYKIGAGTITLTAVATAAPAPTVQWQVSSDGGATFADIPGATTATAVAPAGRRTSSLTFTPTVAANGNRYRAIFSNSAGSTSTSWTNLTVQEAPTLTGPSSLAAPLGTPVTLTASATGTPAPTFQWKVKVNGTYTTIPGATASTYTTPPLPATPLGTAYSVTATNVAGSSTAYVEVFTAQAPAIATQPTSPILGTGTSGTVSAAFTSGAPTTQSVWQRSTDGGATWASWRNGTRTTVALGSYIDSVSLTGGTSAWSSQYRLLVTSSLGTATSNAITVLPPTVPTITQAPQAATVATGESATFAIATSDPTATYQWEASPGGSSSYSPITGATSASYTTTPRAASDDATMYRVKVSYTGGSLYSVPVQLTVLGAPLVTSTSNRSAAAGALVSATSTAYANPAPTPTWEISSDGGTTWRTLAPTTVTPGRPLTRSTADIRVLSTSLVRTSWTNSYGTTVGSPWTITVASPQPLAVIANPTEVATAPGSSVSLTAAALGTSAATVTWERRDAAGTVTPAPVVPVTTSDGATTTSTYAFTVSASDLGTELRAVFSVGSDQRTTTWAAIRPLAPAILAEPTTVTVYGDIWYCTSPEQLFQMCPPGAQKASFTATAGGVPSTALWQVRKAGAATWSAAAGTVTTSSSGATTTSTIAMTGLDGTFDGAQVRATFTNAFGTASTVGTTFTVEYSPTVTADPQDVTVAPGGTATFTVGANGNPAPTVDWYRVTDGTTSSTSLGRGTTLTLANVTVLDDGMQVQAVVKNGRRFIDTSAVATLHVSSAPSVEAVVQPDYVPDGTPVTMSFSATGSPAPAATFAVSPDGIDWIEVPDATVVVDGDRTTVSVDIEAPIDANGWKARARFTNAAGTATTDTYTLRVGTPPVVDPVAAPDPVPAGTAVVMSFSATATPAPDVTFEISPDGIEWIEVADADVVTNGNRTTTFVEIEAPLDADGWMARARFTNVLGTVLSDTYVLRVIP